MRARQAEEKLLKKSRGLYADTDLVFTDEHGHQIPLDYCTKAFRAIADAAELPKDISLHSLRHTFASSALGRGVDVVSVSSVLGHSKVSTTLDIYAHATEEGRKRAVQEVAEDLRIARTAGGGPR